MWGLLSGGAGFGLLIAYVLLETHQVKDDMILGILAMLFGGFGLIGYYFIKRKRDKKQL
jgi:ABC-type Mn2+/Zn2+ transport system permease subunit